MKTHSAWESRLTFQLEDIRKSHVWQEAHDKGKGEGRTSERREVVHLLLARGMSLKKIAETLNKPLGEIRRLANRLG